MEFLSLNPADGLMKCGPMFEPPIGSGWQCLGVARASITIEAEGAVFKTPSNRHLIAVNGQVHVLDSTAVKTALIVAKFKRALVGDPPNPECMDCDRTDCEGCEVPR